MYWYQVSAQPRQEPCAPKKCDVSIATCDSITFRAWLHGMTLEEAAGGLAFCGLMVAALFCGVWC